MFRAIARNLPQPKGRIMAGWQDDEAKKARAKADSARGTSEYSQLAREADAKEAVVNESMRASGQKPKY